MVSCRQTPPAVSHLSTSHEMGVQIRKARYSELPSISQVLSKAFWDDNLNGDLIHPYRNQYPADVELYWLRRSRVNFWDYAWSWVVAVDRNEEEGKEAIVGIAVWARLGDGSRALQCSWYDPRESIRLSQPSSLPLSPTSRRRATTVVAMG